MSDTFYVRGQAYSLRKSMQYHAKTDPRWARALKAYDTVPTKKPKRAPKPRSGNPSSYGPADLRAFCAQEPELAAAFKLAPESAQQARLEGNLFYLGDPPAKPLASTPAREPKPQGPRWDGNCFYLDSAPAPKGSR